MEMPPPSGILPSAALRFPFFLRACQAGDEIRLITEKDTEILNAPKGAVQLMLKRNYPDALFLRLELYRSYAPGLPPMKALLSNPVYFG